MESRITRVGGTAGSDSSRTASIPFGAPAYWLSAALAVVTAAMAVVSLAVPSVLVGPAVMNGSARGTAVVCVAVAVPVLLLAMVLAARGLVRAVVVWLGAVTYLLYNSVLFIFATPFNRLFLVNLAMFALGVWSIAAVLQRVNLEAFTARVSARLPARAIAGYMFMIVFLNAAAWLAVIVPALFSANPTGFLAGTGMTTDTIKVQDLAFWLPLAAVTAIWLWRRTGRGYLFAGAVLTFWMIEALGVGVDQWFGSAADPSSGVASAIVLPFGVALAAIGLVPLFFYFRNLDRGLTEP